MPRSAVAYLSDILEACAAVEDVLAGVDLETYLVTRSICGGWCSEITVGGYVAEPSRGSQPTRRRLSLP